MKRIVQLALCCVLCTVTMLGSGVVANAATGNSSANPFKITYEATSNVNQEFTIVDGSGNTTSVIVPGASLNIRFYAPKITSVVDLNPDMAAHKTVKIVGLEDSWGSATNTSTPPKIVKIGYSSGNTAITWIPINGGIQGNGVEAYTSSTAGEFFLDNMSSGEYVFYLQDETGASSEGQALTLVRPPYNFSITAPGTEKLNVPIDNPFEIWATIRVTGMSEDRQVRVEWYVNNVLTKTEYITMGPYLNEIVAKTMLTAPATAGTFKVHAVVNSNYQDRETSSADNKSTQLTITASKVDLGLRVDGVPAGDGMVFGYSADEASHTFQLSAAASEIISRVEYNNMIYNPNAQTYNLTAPGLAIDQNVSVKVIVSAFSGKYTKTYDIILTKFSHDVGAVVTITAGGITKTFEYSDSDEESPHKRVNFPDTVTSYTAVIKPRNPRSKITSAGGSINEPAQFYMCEVTGTVPDLLGFNIESGDYIKSRSYSLTVTNDNTIPSIVLTNRDELNNGMATIYGLNGFKRNGVYKAYGTETTAVVAALNAGATNGIVLQVAVTDEDYGQYLKGTATMLGKNYPVYWNSLTGDTVMKGENVKYGYVYIRVTDSIVPGNDVPITVSVQDYKDIDCTVKASSSPVTVTTNVDLATRGPIVVLTASSALVEGNEADVTATINGGSSFAGYDVSVQYSADGGQTYSTATPITSSPITVTGSGSLMVKVSAKDSMNNVGTATTTLMFAGAPGDAIEANVFVRKTRLADYYFIGTNNSNDAVVNAGAMVIEVD